MSKRYLVKETSVATENNTNFKGETIYTYYGKGGVSLKREGFSDKDMEFWELNEYGYKRECDAKRCWDYKHPENSEYWQSTVEIVCYELYADRRFEIVTEDTDTEGQTRKEYAVHIVSNDMTEEHILGHYKSLKDAMEQAKKRKMYGNKDVYIVAREVTEWKRYNG